MSNIKNYKGARFNQRSGYTNMGGISVPPLPTPIILTDRDDGTLYLLSSNEVVSSSDDLGHISITTDVSITQRERADVYDAFDTGPRIGKNGEWLLFIRGGHIGIEEKYLGPDKGVYTRERRSQVIRRLYMATDLVWTDDV